MSDKNDSCSARRVSSEGVSKSDEQWQEGQDGHEWHLEFPYTPGFPYSFPIVPAGARDKHDTVGHLSNDGRVHVFNSGIIEKLVRAGLRARVREKRPI
jgi:hypothetical protein